MFLEQQISILEWFLKIMWHWRLEEWCWKFSFDHRNQFQFKIYSYRKQLFKIVIIFQILTVDFWSNKCSFGEHKRLLPKPLKTPKLLSSSVNGQSLQFLSGSVGARGGLWKSAVLRGLKRYRGDGGNSLQSRWENRVDVFVHSHWLVNSRALFVKVMDDGHLSLSLSFSLSLTPNSPLTFSSQLLLVRPNTSIKTVNVISYERGKAAWKKTNSWFVSSTIIHPIPSIWPVMVNV